MEATELLTVSSYPDALILRWISVLSCVFWVEDAFFVDVDDALVLIVVF